MHIILVLAGDQVLIIKYCRASTRRMDRDLRLLIAASPRRTDRRSFLMPALKPGTPAPAFSLFSTPDQKVALSEFRGRPVVLVFYPADWSPVCSDQLALYNELLPEFAPFDAEILGISVDGSWCHLAFSKDRKFRVPLLADFEPKGAVARLYGVYDSRTGESERALFVIDAKGII